MGIKEKIELLEELRKLPEKKQWEVYFMIKGAALVAEKSNYVTAVEVEREQTTIRLPAELK